jgi:hypothetical protein
VSTRRAGFAKFYHRSTDDRLRAVLVRAGDLGRARISISRLTSRAGPGRTVREDLGGQPIGDQATKYGCPAFHAGR